MATIEDRLRRTYDTIAERTAVISTEPTDLEDAWPQRRNHTLAAAVVVAVLVTFAIAAAWATLGTRHRVVVTDGEDRQPTTSTTVPTTTLPATPTEQHLETVPLPPQLQGPFAPTGDLAQVEGTQMQALSVDGTTAFALGDIAPSDFTQRNKIPTSHCVIWLRPDGEKTAGCSGAKSLVQALTQFPHPENDVVVWTGLPAGTAYVTLRQGNQFLRQTPARNTVAFIIETRPRTTRDFIGQLARMRAYDIHGKLLDDTAG
jgi:hypothetical protein